jgi:DNA-binding NtrC family response regulator
VTHSDKNAQSNSAQQSHFALDHLIGDSPWAQHTRKRVTQVAKYRYSVLISGPSGTGKELVAKAIHAHGPRSDKPFIPVNCAAIPSGLFSSQLFGHTKGAFTGAHYASLGCFRAADGGTIFLDEIGELDLDNQAKLLRVLQERIVTPVGSTQGETVDVRTVAATNRSLPDEVREGRFRLDLYYRLNVLAIETKGLADRTDDIEPLVLHFLAKTAIECGIELKRISATALELLEAYAWPGNVRELENFIDRAVVMTEGDVIGPEAFPDILDARTTRSANVAWSQEEDPSFSYSDPPAITDARRLPSQEVWQFESVGPTGEWLSLAEVEKQHISRTLHETFFNQSAAARLLQIDRKMLARKIKKYEIPTPGPRGY